MVVADRKRSLRDYDRRTATPDMRIEATGNSGHCSRPRSLRLICWREGTGVKTRVTEIVPATNN